MSIASIRPPRFSVVVPVYRVQGYLRECLDSILEQSFVDVEIIAVDDCSPDACGAILDEYAARDPRVIPIHCEVNAGMGRARNIGVERARGDYILFLDSDDALTPGALAAIAAQLDITVDPDILLFDHVRTYWWGRIQPSAVVNLLKEPGHQVFTALERQEFLKMFAVVWNRVYRREFYLSHGFAFTDGIYEDALIVYKTMLSAERVSALGRVCVEYRQRRQGNSMRTPGRQHFIIFEQYQRLFEFLDARPHLDALRPVMFERMVSHFIFTMAREGRIPASERADFFRLAAAQYKRYKPQQFERPTGSMGTKFKMMATGSYTAFEAAKLAGATRKKVRTKVRMTRNSLARTAMEKLYQNHLKRPIDENLVVYSAYWNRGVACNPAAIYRKAQELAPHLRGVWVVRKGAVHTVPEGVEYVIANSRHYWEAVARAKYLVNNVNFADEVVKRPGQIHLQTHHGTPLKVMGIDQQRYPAAAKDMDFGKLLARADRWDFSVSSNQHTTEVWERVYPCAFTSVESGYPRNDVYYTSTEADVARIRREIGIEPGKTAILYAPTLRDYQKGYVPRLDLERLCRELGSNFVVLVRTHYQYGRDAQLRQLQEQGVIMDVSSYPVVEDLCLAADALITDYSSIMFDYANLDRPIVSYVDDWDTYVKARGVYFDLASGAPGNTPGVLATTQDELIDAFTSGAWNGEQAARLRTAFRERFCQYDDGHAAERVVRQVFLGEQATPSVIPLPQRTPAPRPRSFGAASIVAAQVRRASGGQSLLEA